MTTSKGEARRWAVWRQDDHGNRFRVSRGHSKAEAEALAKMYEDRGHKQMYWCEEEAA